MTREEMIFVLSMQTNFSEEYLMSLSTERINELYKERVEKKNENNHS